MESRVDTKITFTSLELQIISHALDIFRTSDILFSTGDVELLHQRVFGIIQQRNENDQEI